MSIEEVGMILNFKTLLPMKKVFIFLPLIAELLRNVYLYSVIKKSFEGLLFTEKLSRVQYI